MQLDKNILNAIGNTSLVRLNSVVPQGCAEIYVKLEWENPTGSMKDRSAQAMLTRAEEDGRLKPGYKVIEYTGGSTGTSLAFVCSAKGYKIHIVTSDAFSKEKLDHMAALGAQLTIVPSEGGKTTKELILKMIATAEDLAKAPETFMTNQLYNEDSIAGYFPMAEEIWEQLEGNVDAFVQSAGTAASTRGVATVLKNKNSNIKIVVVEPGESAVLAGGDPTPHDIEGVGIGYQPPLWDPNVVDELVAVPSADAMQMARRLAREEGLLAGTSSGANVIAAIKVGLELGPDAKVATLMVDSGLKYMSTDLYKRA